MPPKSKTPSLPVEQLDVARALFLRRGATPKWVASQLDPPAHWRAVEAAARQFGWIGERLDRNAALSRSNKRSSEEMVALEAEQDERHALQARRVLEARDMLIDRAVSDIQTMSPAQARKALRDFDGLKDLQFVERLARDRKTDKTETTTSEVAQALHDVAAALDRAEGVDPADAEGVGDDAPGPGVDGPRGPEAGSS